MSRAQPKICLQQRIDVRCSPYDVSRWPSLTSNCSDAVPPVSILCVYPGDGTGDHAELRATQAACPGQSPSTHSIQADHSEQVG